MQITLPASCLFGKTNTARLFWGGLLFLLLILTRWAWIDCDGGTESLTEYGYFATDEGFYAGGGKQKFLYDMFISVPLASPCTYAICPASHVLTWASFLVFGQTTWAHRVFPFLLGTIAWLGLFSFLSRKTLAWIAFVLCTCCILNPFLMVYGRTACNDTLMASVLLLGYIVTRKKGLLFPFLGGCIFSLGIWVKPSIWVLLPIGLSGAAMSLPSSNRFRRILFFSTGFLVSICIQYELIQLLIYKDALSQNVTIAQLLKISNSSYPLPNPFDWISTFKGLSSFPRCPSNGLLGLWIPLFLVLPALLLLRRFTDKPVRWDGRLLLYITLPIYTAGICILPVFYAHYYIPLIVFIPILWFEARHDLKLWMGRNLRFTWALMIFTILYVMISFNLFVIKPNETEKLAPILSDAYALPQQIVWYYNKTYILEAAGILTMIGLWVHYARLKPLIIAGLFISALGVANICYSHLPLSEAYKYTSTFSVTMKDIAYLLQVVSIVLFFAVWVLPERFRRSTRWYYFFILLFVCGTAANPVWRKGAMELTKRGHLHKQAVSELAKLVPENAVVFGERAPQLFLSLKARVAPFPNEDPVPAVLRINKLYPERPLFALIDVEHGRHFFYYEKNSDKIQMPLVHKLTLPSFSKGLPSDVYLIALLVNNNPGP